MMKKFFLFLAIASLTVGCIRNHAPVISEITCLPETRKAGTLFTLKVSVKDEDGDLMTYTWKADEGSFSTTTNTKEVKWKSPPGGSGETCIVSVTVSDGEIEVSQDFMILLTEPDLGGIEGHFYYTNFKIPIPEVTVRVGDKTTTTDMDGYFSFSGIPAGENTIASAKQDFSSYSRTIQVIPNDTLIVNAEITSVNHTTKLSGIISDQDGEPIENVVVAVLNPDGSESKLKSTTTETGFYNLWYIPHGERTIVVKKPSTFDFIYTDLKEKIEFDQIETHLNLVMQKVALTGTFRDTRDNHIYSFRTIGSLTWMTENLAYLPDVSPSKDLSNDNPLYYVYGYQGTKTEEAITKENFSFYGVLYNKPAAMKACPPGWHLPTTAVDWSALYKTLSYPQGKQMKSKSGWLDHGDGDNSSGFNAFPGGMVYIDGFFIDITRGAYFWTASETSGVAIFQGLSFSSDAARGIGGEEKIGCSVRCVRNQ